MPLAAGALKGIMKPLIFAQLQAKFPVIAPHPQQIKQQQDLADAIATGVCEALIPYLISNTIVTVTTTSSGATSPGPIGGPMPIPSLPGTGTGTIS